LGDALARPVSRAGGVADDLNSGQKAFQCLRIHFDGA
jgi:hypothetical protein